MSDDPIRVRRWMSADLVTASPSTALGDALETMNGRRIRHLPILDNGGLVGLLSDRDARRCIDGGASNAGTKTPVRELMTHAENLRVVFPDTLVREAAELLCRQKISALPVVEGMNLVGIVTSEDLLWAFLETTED